MSAKSKIRPDVIIVCSHDVKDGPAEFVQRFQWKDNVWIPKDTTGEKWATVGGLEGSFESAEQFAELPVGRQHLNTECRGLVNGSKCRNKVPMEWDRGQEALSRLWREAESVFAALGLEQGTAAPLEFSLSKLRTTYDDVPRSIRGTSRYSL